MAKARKIATNLLVRADVLAEAKELGLNLSEVFESAVINAVRRKRQDTWLADNRQAIETYNARVARELFSEAWRKF